MSAADADAWPDAPGALRLALRRIARAYPLHGHILAGWDVHLTDDIPTMGVTLRDGHVWLYANPGFVARCSLPELGGVLLHETNHVLFGHLLLDAARFRNRAALTVAEEVTVNEWVGEPLPGKAIVLGDYPFLPPDESVEARYRRLEGLIPDTTRVVTLDDHSPWDAAPPGAAGRLAVQAVVRTAIGRLDADAWRSLPGPLRQAARRAASGSGGGETIEPVVEPGRGGTIDWRVALRRFLASTRHPRPSLHRPSRRFPALVGVVPGRQLEPQRRRILAVIDTSASIGGTELQAIGTELLRLRPENDVVVAESDARVQRVYPLTGPICGVQGRGGTDLRPALEPAFLLGHQADVVVYFTDGYGPAPDRPPVVPVLWCLTPGGVKPARWGGVARM